MAFIIGRLTTLLFSLASLVAVYRIGERHVSVYAGLAGFYYFADESTLLRVIGLLIAFFAAVAVASQTEHGRFD